MWITEKMKIKAKQTNLIKFLQKNHPELIYEKKPGSFVYEKRRCISFYKGRDGLYRYCDHQKRKNEEEDYFGDGIRFLVEYVGGYSFETAALALIEFGKEDYKKGV